MQLKKSKFTVFSSVLWIHTCEGENLFDLTDEELFIFNRIVQESLC